MDTLSYKTISVNKETAQKEWVVVDASDQIVGRFCSKVAKLLRGKYKPSFTPHVDCGDNVIIINAEKIKFSGKKRNRQAIHTLYWLPRRTTLQYPCRSSYSQEWCREDCSSCCERYVTKGSLGSLFVEEPVCF